jgi:protoheme IX farnesyltransferase
MALAANPLAAGLLALTICFYLFVYTMWLKRKTPQNIVIGGAAGALPPLVGWAAVTGDVALAPIVLFLIIFFWTPPHFWALALYRGGDYARAGVPMLPVVAGTHKTCAQILLYTLMLVPLSLAPALLGFAGALYAGMALASGGALLALAFALWRARAEQEALERHGRRLFAFSILYLALLFGALLAERMAGLAAFAPLWT